MESDRHESEQTVAAMESHQHDKTVGTPESDRQTSDLVGNRSSEATGKYFSEPDIPPDLWDVDDMDYANKVRCDASIRVLSLDPKNGSFEARMKCRWLFRTLNSGDRTDINLWVPGIRMPGVVVTCEESRIWRDHSKSTSTTFLWEGTSLFHLSGFEIFEMEDFPFDRQVIDLELLEFVWRRDKDSSNFDFAMKLVAFSVETASLSPEWSCYPANVVPEEEVHLGSGPAFVSRFEVKLRLEREHWFYIVQIFLVTYLITTVTCFPLAMPPTVDHVGDRLSLYGGGCLTLVAFKYGVSDHLPSVPYATFADMWLLLQVVTIMILAAETLVVYRFATNPEFLDEMDVIENTLLVLICLGWMIAFVYSAFFKRRRPWKWTLTHQCKNEQVRDLRD